jgi:outer membrane protein assembly factor BamB
MRILKRAASISAMAIIVLAALSTPFVRSDQTSRSLGIKPQLERKDTFMLDLQYPVSGPDAWDIPHNFTGLDDEVRGMKAVASMIDSYYGGNLSQDRIAYYVYHNYLRYPSPEEDLGDAAGVMAGLNILDILSWELNGALFTRFMGAKPGFWEISNWISSNIPIIRDGGGDDHLLTIIDGYDTDGQIAYVLDPLTGNESKFPYDSLDTFVMWIITGDHITARSDEPTVWMDSDSDGIVDFDEANRFHTDPYNNDTYGLGINDKTVIKLTYMDHLTFPTAAFKCSPETPSIFEQVTFDASQSSGNLTEYRWNFGDGNETAATEPAINHTYVRPGTYNVTLTVKDNNSLWNITTSSVTIHEIQNRSENVSEAAFYRQSLDRKGYAPTEGPETPDLLWTSYLNDSVTTSPVVADGKVFVGTSGGKFCALDTTTGEIIWTFDAGSPVSSSPAFQNGTVFFGTENPGKIYAIDARTGLAIWLYQVRAGAAVYSSPAVIDDKVIVGSSEGQLLCLDKLQGQVLWTTQLGVRPLSSPAIQNGTVFVASSLGVDAVDMQTGISIWEFATSWPVTSTPAVADGLVFVGTENNDRVYALDQSTGNPLWNFFTSGWLTAPAVDSSKQLVIVGSKDYKLYAFEEHTGLLEWRYFNGPNYLTAPTISTNGLVYVGTFDGNLCCLNETTGEEVWKYNVATPILSSPSIIHEHVLVGTQEGKIFCFGPRFIIHNIAVSNLTMSSNEVEQGSSLKIDATAKNQGDSVETFNVTLYVNETVIETREITIINGTSTTMTFIWNTTGFAYGNYSVTVYAWPVPGESDVADNTFYGWATITNAHTAVFGDLNGDHIVDILDAIILANHFNVNIHQTDLWDPNADLNDDGVIDILDAILLSNHFNQHQA